MSIIFNDTDKTITLSTAHTSYQMAVGRYGFLLHLYYGSRIRSDMRYLLQLYDRGFSGNPYEAGDDRTFSLDTLPQEYPVYGNGDYRSYAFSIQKSDGTYGCDLRYVSHRIIAGKYAIPGLPAVYSDKEPADTLEVTLADLSAGVEVILRYGVLEQSDIITRCAEIRNTGTEKFAIRKAASASLDLLSGDYDLLHFHGRHGMERNLERDRISHELITLGSRRGTSSHHQNPFSIIAGHGTTEDAGACYGMMLLYSGNFAASAEKDPFGLTRMMSGLQDDMFSWTLAPGECFHTPEAALSYTGNGLNALSRLYHAMIRYHVVRGPWREKRRPVLINNWEATLFDFTGDKIVSIARKASELGVEMMVLDDGWFGARNSDKAGLGDWYVNEKKLGRTMGQVADEINAMGMKFGLWIEPEMVNEDSDLYRAHPDWAFAIPGRKPVRGRSQLVLDFSRREVVDAVFDQISDVIDHAHIEYIKMDMNRSICDVYSQKYRNQPDLQNYGRIMHEYVLGVYDFLERLLTRYPGILIEGCSGGGGRYDAGMMYYTPQIWLSDNTDAIERITIQHGSSYGYPVCTVGSHVSAVPNQQTGRTVPIHTRAVVAMSGSFGYELDLNLISDAEKEEVKEEIRIYKKYWNLLHNGLYYRLTDPTADHEAAAWEFTAEDRSEALLSIVTLNSHCNAPLYYVHARGLDPDALYYREEDETMLYSGSALMDAGIPVPYLPGEYNAWQYHFIRK